MHHRIGTDFYGAEEKVSELRWVIKNYQLILYMYLTRRIVRSSSAF